MYRVELKVVNPQVIMSFNEVPNVPCGVESNNRSIWLCWG